MSASTEQMAVLSEAAENPSHLELSALSSVAREIQEASGFKLLLVVSTPSLFQNYTAKLHKQLPQAHIQAINFDGPITSLYSELSQQLEQPTPNAVVVSGLEHSVPKSLDAITSSFIADLEATHHLFAEMMPCPVVLELPYYVLNVIRYGASKFFAMSGGSVTGVVDLPQDIQERLASLTSDPALSNDNLTMVESQKRAQAMQELLTIIDALPQEKCNPVIELDLRRRLSDLLLKSSSYQLAQQQFDYILTLSRDHLERELEGFALAGLGDVQQELNDWEAAERFYQQSLQIACALNDHENQGGLLGKLASVYLSLGKLSEAETQAQEATDVSRRAGFHVGEAQGCFVLGNIYVAKQQWGKAEESYKQGIIANQKANFTTGDLLPERDLILN